MGMQPAILPAPQRKDATVPAEDEVRCLLCGLMKRSGKDRKIIAQEMTGFLGRFITPSMLADFTRNGTKKRQPRFPCAWIKPFNIAVGNDELTRSQLSDDSRRALALGEVLLPWILEKGRREIARLSEGKGQKTAKRSKR